MRVNIVVKGEWILERLAREIAAHIPGVDINASGWPPSAVTDHDVTYCLPAKNIRHFPKEPKGIRVGFFTHGDDRTRMFWQRFHVCLAMNQRMGGLLREFGAPRVQVIRPGTEPPSRPMVFGVCARTIGSERTRKGLDLVEAAVGAGFDVRACTPDPQDVWPCPVSHHTKDRAAFYQSIDYLIVTSSDEGGPMVVPEAIAAGVPVIAPDVGWCWEFPVIRYDRNWRALRKVLTGLTRPPTWHEWTEAHRALFADLEGRPS